MAISNNPFYNPNTYMYDGYASMDYFQQKEQEYRRYRREQEEKERYMAEQERKYGKATIQKVAPDLTPLAPDPLGFMNKAENKLLLTTGELK